MDPEEDKNSLFKEIGEREREIQEIENRIPPHSVRYEMIQLLEEKEGELKRKKGLLRFGKEDDRVHGRELGERNDK